MHMFAVASQLPTADLGLIEIINVWLLNVPVTATASQNKIEGMSAHVNSGVSTSRCMRLAHAENLDEVANKNV